MTGHQSRGETKSSEQPGFCSFLLPVQHTLATHHSFLPRTLAVLCKCPESLFPLRVLRPVTLGFHPHSETRNPAHRIRSPGTGWSCVDTDGELVVASDSQPCMLWWPLASSLGCGDWPQGREDGWGARNWQAGRGEGGEALTAGQMLVIL